MIQNQPSFSARTDRTLIRAAGNSERFVLVELVAPTPERDPDHERPPVNLAFVLDRSGSMAGRNKLDVAKAGVLEAIARLSPRDRFSVVTYDDDVEVLFASAPATPEARRTAADELRPVQPGSSTNLSAGWFRGAEQVAAHLVPTGVNRVILLTDGLANRGITDHDELAKHAWQLWSRGVATSTIGVGEDFDERLLNAMADKGGGRYFFAGSIPEIRDHLTGEVGEALEVVARDVRLHVTSPAPLAIRALTPHMIRPGQERIEVRVGDLVAGQLVRIVLRLRFPEGLEGDTVRVLVGAKDVDGVLLRAGGFDPVGLEWQYASHAANDAQPRDRVVDRIVAGLFAARAREDAVQVNRVGDYREAQRILHGVAKRIAAYAGDDVELGAIVSELRHQDMPMFAAPMPELSLKEAHFRSANLQRGRDDQGRSLRR